MITLLLVIVKFEKMDDLWNRACPRNAPIPTEKANMLKESHTRLSKPYIITLSSAVQIPEQR
jgi:hypothetical protein